MSEQMLTINEGKNFSRRQNHALVHHLETSNYPPTSIARSEAKIKRKSGVKQNMERDNFFNLLHGSDPLKMELNRLENEVRGKITTCTTFALSFTCLQRSLKNLLRVLSIKFDACLLDVR